MLGTVSHELRNTLTGIVGLTEIVSSASDLEPEEARELIGLAHRQAVDATEIVEDMLTATSMERSALTVENGAIDFNHEVVTTVRRFVGLGTAVEVDLADAVPMARGDALRVRQIIRNLVSNAVRYGGETIVVSTRADGDRVQVIVADDGVGVLPEDESTIFLPYRRSTNTRRDASSVGLGLWICGQLAIAMGGTLTYRRVDHSTQFVLALAADRDDSLPAKSELARGPVFPKTSSTRSEGQVVPVVAI
jgi:signal transduction histidine kinase